MKSPCNTWVLVRNPDTSKEIVQFVHEVRPVFAVTLSTLVHMLCGWNDDTMPSFNLFRVHLKCFSISGSFSSKKLVNAWKIPNGVRKGWKLMMWLWMVHLNTEKLWSSTKFKKVWKTLKCPCNTWVLVRNTDTPKEIVQFVHEVRPVFAVTLSTLFHMLCGRNDDTMPSSNIFRVHFVVIFNFTVI